MLDSAQIEAILPHRYPMLLVDKIIEMNDDSIVGQKYVSSNEAFFQGHFPNKKIMPGVLIVESLAQTGAVLLLSQPQNKGKIAFLAGINKMRFKKQVYPGTRLNLYVTLTKMKAGIGFADVVAKDEDEAIVAQGEIMFGVGQ